MKHVLSGRRGRLVAAGAALTLVAGAVATNAYVQEQRSERLPWKAHELLEQMKGEKDLRESSAGTANGGSGGEAFEAATAAQQFADHRGIVQAGDYTKALSQISALPTLGATPWSERTGVRYDADDPAYRDYYSNSSGGSGLVTGRVTGIAADAAGNVYAGGADGGVWRRPAGSSTWTSIADSLGTLSTGDLRLDGSGNLWYATGEANTGGTSYVGLGVYRLTNPSASGSSFTAATRVGGTELESTTIGKIRFTRDAAFVATNRGIWSHPLTGSMSAPWQLRWAPNPSYLPGGSSAGDANAAYKNIVNDLVVDPKDARHLVAAVGWRGGDTYNGFYESTDGGASWARTNLNGGIDATDIGQTTFGFSADGSKLYAVVQSIALYNKAVGTVNSYLKGVYVSNSGNPAGPWTKIADSTKLANSGSALKQSVGGKGYGPGIQSWYNQFVGVDPKDPNHIYVGLEEVYETRNGGSSWSTPGPYWNFYFGCWDYTKPSTGYPGPGASIAGCNQSTHPDQHAVAFGSSGGKDVVYVGNDGGIYARPVNGSADADGHATDWTSLNDGSIDALQYYAVGVGPEPATTGGFAKGSEVISGGLQDNGGSILRTVSGKPAMSSNFGGDGGDVLVDPANGCNIVQEYVYLSMEVTNVCAVSPGGDGFVNPAHANTRDIAPPDVNARFIAPFDADRSDRSWWIAGGQHVWVQNKGFAITSGSDWRSALDLGSGRTATAVAMDNHRAVVAWCGPCNNSGFTAGVEYTDDVTAASPVWKHLGSSADVAQRYIGGVTVTADGKVYAVTGGFSRKFTEGPGADVAGHVWSLDPTKVGAAAATTVDGTTFPNVPANTVKVTPAGTLVVGTDLGVFALPAKAKAWYGLAPGLPRTTVMDVEVYGGKLYAATHGRGIWSLPVS